jgi:hypothetical protein
MNKILTIFVVAVISLNACISSGGSTNFADISGKEWKLIEVHINGANTGFNRNALAQDGFEDSFTLNFDGQIVSGVGAPNLYTAPFTLSENQTIDIMVMRTTLMSSIFEPENLREHDYFSYLENAVSWRLVNNNLEILSKTRDGRNVRLLFTN